MVGGSRSSDGTRFEHRVQKGARQAYNSRDLQVHFFLTESVMSGDQVSFLRMPNELDFQYHENLLRRRQKIHAIE